jgi:hypothetical protein
MGTTTEPGLGLLTQGAVDVITPGELEAKVATGRRLRVLMYVLHTVMQIQI